MSCVKWKNVSSFRANIHTSYIITSYVPRPRPTKTRARARTMVGHSEKEEQGKGTYTRIGNVHLFSFSAENS